MKKMGEIMAELGFDERGNDSTKAAFIKHLFKKAYGVEIEVPEKLQPDADKPTEEQLSLPGMSKKGA